MRDLDKLEELAEQHEMIKPFFARLRKQAYSEAWTLYPEKWDNFGREQHVLDRMRQCAISLFRLAVADTAAMGADKCP